MKGKTTESDVPITVDEVSDEEAAAFDLDPHLINLMLHEPLAIFFASLISERLRSQQLESVSLIKILHSFGIQSFLPV